MIGSESKPRTYVYLKKKQAYRTEVFKTKEYKKKHFLENHIFQQSFIPKKALQNIRNFFLLD